MLTPFLEIRNIGVRAGLKREDDDCGLGHAGFEVPVEMSRSAIGYMGPALRGESWSSDKLAVTSM